MFTPHYQPKKRPKFINPSQIPIIVLRYPPNLPFQNCDCDPNPILQNPQEKKRHALPSENETYHYKFPWGNPHHFPNSIETQNANPCNISHEPPITDQSSYAQDTLTVPKHSPYSQYADVRTSPGYSPTAAR
ncbi:hypothetical protein HBH64_226290 [Parastagonospora nodorum]|nr:hypothetical protein HBI02_229160 [Parastagonospora nodorum]KAH4295255.1 hypothetical protein HBI01_158850 [Parastagonospora nodorum]KAH4321545.1 hypothetical protein HBI00_212750 [Parastagonospora nodorum]KAH4356217.1 hypothetical protein HBH94_228710 [Parastagonospora nodorum]KAH4444494.1 hypothetical protein HBH90_220200 [Parastagonospora nodorum]